VLSVGDAGLRNGSAYAVSFEVRNRGEQQESPSVSVSAVIGSVYGPARSSIASSAMNKTGRDALGVQRGADPLLVHVPGFVVRAVGQSNPLASASNKLTLTLAPDCDMAAGSNVTVSGLTGTQTADSDGLDVVVTAGSNISTAAWWRQGDGVLTLRVEGGGLVNGSVYAVTVRVRNGAVGQASPSVSIKATVKAADGVHDGEGRLEAMVKPGTAALGVDGGADPLLVHAAGFRATLMGQSSPLASASNTLTLTLEPDCDMAGGSNVTLSGLTQTQTEDSEALAVSSSPAGVVGETAGWSKGSGQLILRVLPEGLKNHTSYRVWFVLQNQASGQASPGVSIHASVKAAEGPHAGNGTVQAVSKATGAVL